MKLSADSSNALTITSSVESPGFYAVPSKESPRWLVPSIPKLRKHSFALYSPHTLRGRVAKRLLEFGLPRGEPVDVAEAEKLGNTFAAALGQPVHMAISIGTPGAYQKLTALVMSTNGQVLAYAKVGRWAPAIESLTNEARVLSMLWTKPGLRAFVPQVLLWERARDQAVLLLTPGPDQVGLRRFTTHHERFAAALDQEFGETAVFRSSRMWRTVLATFAAIQPMLEQGWRTRFQRSIELIERDLAPYAVRLGLAHRDFTPWNIRHNRDGGLFVFDWEFAAEGYIRDYDYLHFHAMQAALKGRQLKDRGAKRRHSGLLGRPGPHARCTFLAYLLDLSLFYLHARLSSPTLGDDQVTRWSGQQMDYLLGAL